MSNENIKKPSWKVAQQTGKGHKFIKVSLKEMTGPLRGLGICDQCCKAMFEGYLIPVLNSAYCKECFDEWQGRAVYYKDDEFYENMKTEHFLEALNGELHESGE